MTDFHTGMCQWLTNCWEEYWEKGGIGSSKKQLEPSVPSAPKIHTPSREQKKLQQAKIPSTTQSKQVLPLSWLRKESRQS